MHSTCKSFVAAQKPLEGEPASVGLDDALTTGIKERLEGILVPERCGDDEFPEMVVFEEVAEGG
jgi:hypothetical protein